MSNLLKLNEALNTHVRPQCFPVAIKMLEEKDTLPDKTRIPSKNFGKKFAVCQGIGMVRRFGWTLALGREDMSCPLGAIAMGFEEPKPYYVEGNLAFEMFNECQEAGVHSEEVIDKFPLGRYKYILLAPITREGIEPDSIVFYGNTAQVMRLLIAALYKKGGKLTSSFGGRVDCSETIVTTRKTEQCQVILPCNGDRVFGLVQDHEMAFTIPAGLIDDIITGLEGTHKGGIRYPIPYFMNFEGVFPPKYQKLTEMFKNT